MENVKTLKDIREEYIIKMNNSENTTEYAMLHSEDLYALGLTIYSRNFSLESIIYNSFALSELDENISLHPEQLKVIEKIYKNNAVVLSAPTSFGKTFCIFEYIARFYPRNIVLIVPTLALIDEYTKKILRKYPEHFKKYKIYTNIIEGVEVDFTKYNIFIMTHERIISGMDIKLFEEIDFLVIDEVYKLNTDLNDDRVLVLNMAYYYMSKISKKYVLLAPFIENIDNIDLLEKKPIFISTEFSPVVNKVTTIDVIKDKDRFLFCQKILETQVGYNDKTLIYFPTVVSLYKYINEIISNEPIVFTDNSNVYYFLDWAKSEIHEEWAVVKALERGYLIHNGQLQLGTRVFLLDLFDELDSGFDRLLCTSSLLEGVNTSAKNIIITRPSRKKNNASDNFNAFDFFNLVGRTGRLYRHLIGNAYYIKGPNDPIYMPMDAKKSIRFEILDETKDIDVQLGISQKHSDVQNFYKQLGIDNEEYLQKIGTKIRIENCIKLYEEYLRIESQLIQEFYELSVNDMKGRYKVIYLLNEVCTFDEKAHFRGKISASILNELLNLNRINIKTIVDNEYNYCKKKGIEITIDELISMTIKFKAGYIEHKFYNRCNVIYFFMEKRGIDSKVLTAFQRKILSPIEILYFTKSPLKKSLYDMGIYEKDIDYIVKAIGEEFIDVFELKQRLLENKNSLKDISFISKYIINSLE